MDDVLRALDDAMSEGIRKSLGLSDDWVYRDVGWTTKENWELLIGLIGEENVRFLAGSVKGDRQRGQIMVSGAGMENVKAYNATKKN